jgi:chromosome segregation ATPase
LGQAQATAYYGQYLKLVQLDDITQIFRELHGGVWDFAKLCKALKAEKMGVSQVLNLLGIANNCLPSVEHRYEELQKQNSILDSNLSIAAKEFQNLTDQISFMRNRLDELKSKCELEIGTLRYLQQQIAKLEACVYDFRNNDEGYTKLIKTIEEEVLRILSDKKALLRLAAMSIVESIRNNPDRYSSLVDNHNGNSYSSLATVESNIGQYIGLADSYVLQNNYVEMLIEEAEKLYTSLTELFVREVINENVTKQSIAASSFPSALPLKGDDKQEHTEQNY